MIACHSLISRTAPFSPPVATLLVHRARRRQQVTRVLARRVERLDPRCELSTFLILGDERQLALGVLGNAHQDHAEHQGASEAVQALVLAADVDLAVAAVEVPQLDRRHDIEHRARLVIAEPHAGGAREILAWVGRIVHKEELEQVLQFEAREVAGHQGATRSGIHHTGAKGRHAEHIVDRQHTRLSSHEGRAHHAVGGKADVRFRGISEGIGAKIGEDSAGRDVGKGVGKILRRHRQRLIDAVTARCEHGRGDRFLELIDLVRNGAVAGNAVVDRIESIGLDLQLVAVQGDHQLAKIPAFQSGLDHRRAVVDDDRFLEFGMAVGADDDIDARHGLGQAHVVAVTVAPVFPFSTPPWLREITTSTFSVSRRIFTVSLAASMASGNESAPGLV